MPIFTAVLCCLQLLSLYIMLIFCMCAFIVVQHKTKANKDSLKHYTAKNTTSEKKHDIPLNLLGFFFFATIVQQDYLEAQCL